jgi:O-glycosyl hydrolase
MTNSGRYGRAICCTTPTPTNTRALPCSVTGASDGGNNLQDSMYSAFATYLATVVRHFQTSSEYGNIVFDAVTPLNEPCSSWWRLGGDQEGCHFDRDKEDTILALLSQALEHLGATATVLSGPEENSIDDTLTSLQSYESTTLAAIDLITTHTYNGNRREDLSNFAAAHGKRFWNSEFGTGSGPLQGGIQLAQQITNDLNNMNITAWTLWQAVDLDNTLSPDGWGLLAATYNVPPTIFTIRTASGLCLTALQPSNDANVTLQACSGADSQVWHIDSSAQTVMSLVNLLCWDDWGTKMLPGDAVMVGDCWGGPNQRWSIPGDGTIRLNNASGLCVSASAPAAGAGSTLVVQTCNGSPAQGFTVTPVNGSETARAAPLGSADHYSRVQHPRPTEAVRMGAPDAFSVRHQYFAYKQFTSFIRPGSRLIPLSDGNTVAALTPDNNLVLVYTNSGGGSVGLDFQVQNFSAGPTARVFVTDDSHNCTQVASASVSPSGAFSATVGGSSITTFVLEGV